MARNNSCAPSNFLSSTGNIFLVKYLEQHSSPSDLPTQRVTHFVPQSGLEQQYERIIKLRHEQLKSIPLRFLEVDIFGYSERNRPYHPC
jgi:hypothetical protein